MKILILGGYGIFGGRLAHLLADEFQLTLMIAGRSLDKAEAFCQSLSGSASIQAIKFDRDGELDHHLRQIMPNVVVDATGPFQHYGERPYRVIEACIALGINYLDFADGSQFVHGVSQFDAAAKAQSVFVLSGVSSFPVLTAAVVRHLSADMKKVQRVTGGIAPSPYAGVGLNVIRAIAGYAGQSLSLTRGGKKTSAYAFTETMRYTIAPPGKLPLHSTHFSLVDVPDLCVIPDLWLDLDEIWMGAGPVPKILHRILNGLAWLVRLKLLPSLCLFSRLFFWAINIFVWGEHRGGMFVSVEGTDAAGKEIERSWHLLAEGDDGPLIPSMAIEAIIRKSLIGQQHAFGARSASQELELADYELMFARRRIYTGVRQDSNHLRDFPLYKRVLGDAWDDLPPQIQQMHTLQSEKTVIGIAQVDRGRSIFARIVAAIFGFPKSGTDIPVSVTFSVCDGVESWLRNFGGKKFSSTQSEGHERDDYLLTERFGFFSFGIGLVLDDDKLHFVIRRWSVLSLNLPLAWAPSGQSFEFVEDGRFHFHVEISHPLMGLIVRYQGFLVESERLGLYE